MHILTKAQILQGSSYTEDFEVLELEGKVKIRALSDAELTQIDAEYFTYLTQNGVKAEMIYAFSDVDPCICPHCKKQFRNRDEMNLAQSMTIVKGRKEKNWKLAALGLSIGEDKWTVEEVAKIKPEEAVTQIADRILVISGGTQDQVDSFRGDDSSPGTDSPAQDGLQPGQS
jgi:hypothetical protein